MQSYELRGKQSFVSDFSRLLRDAIEKSRGPILYSKKKKAGPPREPEFQGNVFGNNRDITKCQCLHDDDNNDNAKATAITPVFLEKRRDNKLGHVLVKKRRSASP